VLRNGRREEACEILTEVLRLDPRIADAWAVRGRLEADCGRSFNAMLHHGFAIQLASGRHDLWCNRGIDAMGARMYKESAESFERSLAIEPTFEAHYNYGNLLSALMKVPEAIEHFEAAEKIGGVDNPQIYANLGVVLIAEGRWKDGFNRYRHRFNAPGFPTRPTLNYPIWRGEPLVGKTILLYTEQGFGDEIMSYRFAWPMKQQRRARVIVSVRPPMYRLARESLGFADAVILQYDEPPWKPDYMAALLDVPAFVDIDPAEIPLGDNYLMAKHTGVNLKWPEGLKVGLCWASGKRDLQPSVADVAKQKSLTFKHLAPLARPGVTLVCLQQTHNDKEALAELGVKDPMPGVTDFADTAWWISQLDLVITVDTAVAHLAGAMGVPVWNLVRFDALWPWGKATSDTPWYDSMTIFRQPKPFDWGTPLKALFAEFEHLVEKRKAA
jgi:tetratricopeptide (TPR) repeat protein